MLQPPTQNSRKIFLKICSTQDERGGGNYDLLYQNSINMKRDISLYIFCMIVFFLNVIGYLNNIYQIVSC